LGTRAVRRRRRRRWPVGFPLANNNNNNNAIKNDKFTGSNADGPRPSSGRVTLPHDLLLY